MTEAEGAHRRASETLIISSDFAEARRGQYCTTVITTIALVVAGLSIYLGHVWVGFLFGSGSIVPIIIALLKIKTIPHGMKTQDETAPAPVEKKKPRRRK